MKKVLLVVGSLGAGGIEKLVASYSRCLKNNGFQFYYLVFDGSDDFYRKEVLNNGSKIISVPWPHYKNSFYKDISSVLREYGPFDIVHSHILFSSGLVMKAAYKNSVRIRIAHSHDNLTYIRSTFMERVYRAVMRHLLNKYSTKRVACSSSAGEFLFGEVFQKKGVVVKNRVDLSAYKFSDSDRRMAKREIGVEEDQLLIGTIGRIEEQKNQRFIVDIMNDERMRTSNAKAIIIGDGRKKDELLAYIEDNRQEKNVLLLGKKENVSRYLSAMDVFVLPSIHEGLGLVLVEAQANGLPCLAPKDIVPAEVKVLNSFEFIPREDCNLPNKWVDKILIAKRENSEISMESLKKEGYDIVGLKGDLLELYEYGGK